LKALRGGEVPEHWRLHCERVRAILAPIQSRYEAAYAVAVEARRREIEATPIDDEAWQAELRWRAQIETHGGISRRGVIS
jgi:hypothetical protein